MLTTVISSPIGPISITADDTELLSIRMAGRAGIPPAQIDAPAASLLLAEAMEQLRAWLTGRSRGFDLPLAASNTQRGAELRAAISAIGYGETASYGEVARRAGSGPRAIGQACRRNPFPIIVPCHRVIGAAQAIGYYSGGEGVITKRWLLDHEKRYPK